MLIYTHQKSKKRKPTVKQKELAAEWQELVSRTKLISPAKKSSKKVNIAQILSPKPFVRETPKYPSLNSSEYNCFKPIHGKVYTGDKMKGIGTLHKSNAVPIFTDEEAKDQATMRR
jgi:hypothetical protein